MESAADVDVFSFVSGAGAVTISVVPAMLAPNLDIIAEVRNAAGSVIGLITVMEIFHALLQPTAAAPTADTQSQKTD